MGCCVSEECGTAHLEAKPVLGRKESMLRKSGNMSDWLRVSRHSSAGSGAAGTRYVVCLAIYCILMQSLL